MANPTLINSDYNGFELKSALNAICQFAEKALIMSFHVKAIVTRFLLNALMMSSQMNTILKKKRINLLPEFFLKRTYCWCA